MATILVVEDEALISEYLCSILEDAGHQVVPCGTADEALAILESRHDFRLVITDIVMPGSMNGLMLANLVRSRWPSIEIFVASGNARPAVDQMPAQSRFFSKPYVPKQITDAVRKI
jgi:two-component system, response regulator PdtaR